MTRLDKVLVAKCYDAITAIAKGPSEIEPDELALNSIRNPFDGGKGISILKATLALHSVMENEVLARISNRLVTHPNFAIRYCPHQLNNFFDSLTHVFINVIGFVEPEEKKGTGAFLNCTLEQLEQTKVDFKKINDQFQAVEYFFYDVFRVYEEEAVEKILLVFKELLDKIIGSARDPKNIKVPYSIRFDFSALITRLNEIKSEIEKEQEIQLFELLYTSQEKIALAYLIRKHGVTKSKKPEYSAIATNSSEESLGGTSEAAVFSLEDLTLKNIQDDKQIEDVQRIPIPPNKRGEIIDWFRKLVASGKLSATDAAYWICAEFRGFKKLQDTTRRVSPALLLTHQMYFVRQLQQKCAYEDRHSVPRFRAMLKRRLTAFDNKSEANLESHFSDNIANPDSIFH